ncbi:TMEM165/GDT1 family protein [Nocardioides sp.]|uniref:TMEM165/GDT1 family protein n=1 Tax=Nocardioides sp. TaxID=35761 RepID=UPI002CC24E08|nr:TMEM165/GDT1 family protein [Nocardioides sp.]HXH80856.1 TMEM165/GDT1 family protein [Nocardioides sp.]
MDLVVVALTFAAIFVVELPDKTFIATLVLSTRFRPLLVWIGVALAFLVQSLVAVGLGKAATFLPETWVQGAAVAMFLIGAIILLREARAHDAAEGEEEELAARAGNAGNTGGFRVVLTSFLVLFAAEWGDLSQLLTLSLAAKYDDPVSVFLGAWGALLAVSGLAVVVGRVLLARITLSLLHYLGAGVCLFMACLTVWEMTR